MGLAKRKTKGFCEIRLFRPPGAPKYPNLVPKIEFSVFSEFRVHFFMGHHHFWFVRCYGVGEAEDKRIFRYLPFWTPRGPKIPKFVTKNGIFSFFAVQVAFLHGSSPFLVCMLLWGGRRGRQKDFTKFAFLDPRGPQNTQIWYQKWNFQFFRSSWCISSWITTIFGL